MISKMISYLYNQTSGIKMTKTDKLIKKILESKSTITISEAIKILNSLGYVASHAVGSHQTFKKADRNSITLVITDKELKDYLIKKLQKAIKDEGY